MIRARARVSGADSQSDPLGEARRPCLHYDCVKTALREFRVAGLVQAMAKPGTDPDWTVGVLMGRSTDGCFYVLGSSGRASKLYQYIDWNTHRPLHQHS
jgi:hypothetical protein